MNPEPEGSRQAGRVSRAIVRWFKQHGRPLPWRESRDPYAIWISEVMLQQTQVRTVIPYWERWMKLFPRVEDLAGAEEEMVLKAWEGLGYYRRARHLQAAARIVTEKFQGVLPENFEAILDLPGVGRYTAGAICSIAFGQAVPVVDGNVERVLSRLFLISGRAELWRMATRLVESVPREAGAFNQGIMELGATLCSPRAPKCPACPVRRLCAARADGRVAEFPKASPKPAPRNRRYVAVILRDGPAVLVRKRDRDGVNGALWEFPNFEVRPSRGVNRQLALFLDQPDSLRSLRRFATLRHTITRNRIQLDVYAGSASGSQLADRLGSRWIAIAELENLPFSSAHARLRRLLSREPGSG